MRATKIPYAIAVAVAALALTAGCVKSSRVIGDSCSANVDCSGLSGAYCTFENDTCTKSCRLHEDCGCAIGTTSTDVAAGRCEAACDYSTGLCMRVCTSTIDCEGLATCDYYDTTS